LSSSPQAAKPVVSSKALTAIAIILSLSFFIFFVLLSPYITETVAKLLLFALNAKKNAN